MQLPGAVLGPISKNQKKFPYKFREIELTSSNIKPKLEK